jgi:N-acetylmuramoyl-L-alanine amidase
MGRLRALAVVVAAVRAAFITDAADWYALERYQQTITRPDFDRLVSQIYAPSGALTNYLIFDTNSVTVCSTPAKTNALFTLRFAFSRSAVVPHASAISRIVLDPGHIGGQWARMEERFFVRNNGRPVQEAVLNLMVARLLKPQLESTGTAVFLSKNSLEPVTEKRPEDFRAEAERYAATLGRFSTFPSLEREAAVADAARKRAELLFYRSAEIAARSRRINEELKPDLTVCIHFNAVEWNECHYLVDDNRLVLFVHGNYLNNELADDDQKFRLFAKLLERSHVVELSAAEALASALASATMLPPVEYGLNSGAIRVGANPYVYARNLAANRLVDGPVVYLEPYYMNNRIVYQRIQLGDYEGTRRVDGQPYKSIFREYADAVAAGLNALCAR